MRLPASRKNGMARNGQESTVDVIFTYTTESGTCRRNRTRAEARPMAKAIGTRSAARPKVPPKRSPMSAA
jgi:hypothetical protein